MMHVAQTALNKTAFVVSSPQCKGDCSGQEVNKLSNSNQNSSNQKNVNGCNSSNHSSQTSSAGQNTCTYQVAWTINAHMKVGSVNVAEALNQHEGFRNALRGSGADVLQVPFVHGAYDSVFVKDNAVLGRDHDRQVAFLANPWTDERQLEQNNRGVALKDLGFDVVGSSDVPFEGGDLVVLSNAPEAFLGYGFRSSKNAASDIASFLNRVVTPLELKDPHFYHLDTALAVLNDGTAFACRDAFTDESWETLRRSNAIARVIEVSRAEAMRFALNWVEIDDQVVIGSYVPNVISELEALGKKVRVTPLQQFQFAGGSAACLTAKVHQLRA